jgi:L-asparaginase
MLNGELEVPFDNLAVESILKSVDDKYDVAGVVYKDSLEMDADDRKMLANIIGHSSDDTFIIIHGTDTMHITSEFLSEIFTDKKIILVGAMQPFEIDKVESSFNFGMALGFAKAIKENGVYICMSGHVEIWDKLQKNRNLGKFEIVK